MSVSHQPGPTKFPSLSRSYSSNHQRNKLTQHLLLGFAYQKLDLDHEDQQNPAYELDLAVRRYGSSARSLNSG